MHRKTNQADSSPSPSGKDALLASASDAVRRANELREERFRKLRQKGLPLSKRTSAFWTRWCLQEHGHECRKAKDVVKLVSYARRYEQASAGRDFMPYLEWCLAQWKLITAQKFAWMKEGTPAQPSIPFFVRFSETFEAAYLAKETLSKRASMTEREWLIEANMAKGMSEEAAARSADERLGIAQEKQKLEKTLKEIKKERAALAVTATFAPLEKAQPKLKQVQTKRKADDGFGRWED